MLTQFYTTFSFPVLARVMPNTNKAVPQRRTKQSSKVTFLRIAFLLRVILPSTADPPCNHYATSRHRHAPSLFPPRRSCLSKLCSLWPPREQPPLVGLGHRSLWSPWLRTSRALDAIERPTFSAALPTHPWYQRCNLVRSLALAKDSTPER